MTSDLTIGERTTMKCRLRLPLVTVVACSILVVLVAAAPPHLIERKTPTGVVVGYLDTPLQPWTGNKYHVHDPNRPIPPTVKPALQDSPAACPSDAIVLFDGKDLSKWKPNSWKIVAGSVEVADHESLETCAAFGDCQLHVEWMAPAEAGDNFMNRGNSGVLMMGKYELQIFDSWPGHKQQIYPDGQAASIYGQTPPLVNACGPPGTWQSYDIVFTAPVFTAGKVTRRARVTMFHNGVLVLLNQEIMGPMAHRQILPYEPHPSKLPLVLQGHACPVRFRNIWIRPLALPGRPD